MMHRFIMLVLIFVWFSLTEDQSFEKIKTNLAGDSDLKELCKTQLKPQTRQNNEKNHQNQEHTK